MASDWLDGVALAAYAAYVEVAGDVVVGELYELRPEAGECSY